MVTAMSDTPVPPPDDKNPELVLRKRPGPKKGTRPSGRSVGSKNKITIERENRARLDIERAALEARAAKGDELAKAMAQGKRLMKEVIFEFAELNAGLAAFYQPYPEWSRDAATKQLVNGNPNYDEERFRYYMQAATSVAHMGAPFQSPRYSAVMIGAATVTKVKISGGLPNDFEPPKLLAPMDPGTIITAEDISPVESNIIDLTAQPKTALGGE